jgi:hypothetical protein
MNNTPLKNIYIAISNYFYSPISSKPLGIFRIVLGTYFIFYLFNVSPTYTHYYGDSGVVGYANTLNQNFPEALGTPYLQTWPSIYNYITEEQFPLKLSIFILFIASLYFTLGVYSRVSSLIIYILFISILNKNGLALNGEDHVLKLLFFYSIFIPFGRSYSLDSLFGTMNGKCTNSMVNPFIYRLLQINILFIYVFSIPYKLIDDSAWMNGTALYWTALNTRWGLAPNGAWVATFLDGWLVYVLTYWTLFCEAFFVVFVWFRKTRLLACFLLFQLHIAISLALPNTTYFNLVVMINILLFLQPSDYSILQRAFFGLSHWLSTLPRFIKLKNLSNGSL